MKFLIQKINKEIRHDFSFTLIDMIRFKNWIYENRGGNKIIFKFLNTIDVTTSDNIYHEFQFKENYKNYVPIGGVEFVIGFLQRFYGLTPKPINVPQELFHYAGRKIFNGVETDLKDKLFVKSNDKIKKTYGVVNEEDFVLPIGNYQFSEIITIESEWRAFIYENKLVGLCNYSGEFTRWPNVNTIKGMIKTYRSSPVAYTLDVGVSDDRGTFVIECHDFFSCGLYGFNQQILVNMFYRWFQEYLKLNL